MEVSRLAIHYAGAAELVPLTQAWATDPTTISLTVTDPATTTTTYTYAAAQITRASTGSYLKAIPSTIPGRWTGVWTATGAISDVAEQVWSVEPTGGPLVGLAEAKDQLSAVSTINDDQFRLLLEVASQACEDYTGRTWRATTWTESYDGGQEAIVLRHQPVISVTSVSEWAGPVMAGNWFADYHAGILYRGTMFYSYRWMPGRQNVTVTYVTGPPNGIVPSPVRQGVKVLLAHLWDTQRGGANMPRQIGSEQVWDVRRGFSIPNAVREHWDPYRLPAF
jgi:hypothetical protein